MPEFWYRDFPRVVKYKSASFPKSNGLKQLPDCLTDISDAVSMSRVSNNLPDKINCFKVLKSDTFLNFQQYSKLAVKRDANCSCTCDSLCR